MFAVLLDLALVLTVMRGFSCRSWEIKLPTKISGLRNTCLMVPCSFTVPENHERHIQNCSDRGVWRKGSIHGPLVISSRSSSTEVLQGQIVGDITQNNCSTMIQKFPYDKSETLFFRLECPDVQFTFSDGVTVSLLKEAAPPLVTPVTSVMSEGSRVQLQCSTPLTCPSRPPSITWLLPEDTFWQEEEGPEQTEQTPDGQMVVISTLTFMASADLHNQSATCSVSYPLQARRTSTASAMSPRLNILYAPRFTRASLNTSNPVPSGSFVTFWCESDGNPAVRRFLWFREKNQKLVEVGRGQTLVLQVFQRDSGLYLCEAQTLRGSQRSRPVVLEVHGAAGNKDNLLTAPYIISGVLFFIFILTIVIGVFKYQSLSRRLKKIEQKEAQHTYTDLRTLRITTDYDQLQVPRTKARSGPPEDPVYENQQAEAPPGTSS